MIKKPNLYVRFLNYLIAAHKKNSDLWVYRYTLKELAFDRGYQSKTVWNAFEKL